MIDITTFGSFESAKTLAKLINQKPEFEKKVCHLISGYIKGIKYISFIPNKNYQKSIAVLFRNDYYGRVNFDEKINTYIKCVMTAYFRRLVKGEYENTRI